jgi:hypothetical protein
VPRLATDRRGYNNFMAAVAQELRDTEEYEVETPDGSIGRVEEIWLGPAGDPQAVAVRTTDGTHALLLDEDVVTVDREHGWVVVGEHPTLLELAAPRVVSRDGRVAAQWATTGTVVHPEPSARLAGFRTAAHHHAPHLGARPLWQQIAILYVAVALIVLVVVALVFLVAWAATGSPY